MADKQSSKRIKIIEFKDVVSLLLILVIFSCSFLNTFAASRNTTSKKNNLVVTANDLYELQKNTEKLHNIASSTKETEEQKIYNLLKSDNLNNLKFANSLNKEVPFPYDNDKLNGYKIDNYTNVSTIPKTSSTKNIKFPMAAVTYVKEKGSSIEVVISYRSTISGEGWEMFLKGDLSVKNLIKLAKEDKLNTGNWGQNIRAVLLGYTKMEEEVQQYAINIAKHYNAIKGRKTLNIHVTGASLGGYLAQIGGAALLQNSTYKDKVKQITYFNGFGIYKDNFLKRISEFSRVFRSKTDLDKAYKLIKDAYKALKKNKDIVTLYRIKGDWVTPLGDHVGKIIEYYPSNSALPKEKQDGKDVKKLTDTLKLLKTSGLFKIDCSKYPKIYNTGEFKNYIWGTHDLKSFEGYDLTKDMQEFNVQAKFYGLPNILKKRSNRDYYTRYKIN